MLLRIASLSALFASISAAQTLSLVSGAGQMIPYGSGAGSAPITFALMNGSAPVPNQTVTFTNSDGTPATSLIPQSVTTNAAGIATVGFLPAFIGDNVYEGFALEAHYGSQSVSFNETSAQIPPAQILLSAPVQTLLVPFTAKAGQPGPQIQIIIDASFQGPVANVAVRIIPVETGASVPSGSLVQKVTCLEAGSTPEGNVFTNSSGVASCTPIFTYPNAALSAQYDTFTFKISVGDSFSYGPFPYSIAPEPLTISGPLAGTVLQEGAAADIQITGAGGVPPYTFSLSATSGLLPGGLSLEANGQIVGSSNTPGLFPFNVILTDHTRTILESPTFSIAISGGPFVDSPTTIPDAVVGQPYSQSISVSGGVPPYKFSVNGILAPGLTATPSPSGLSITISGTPTAASNAASGFTATDEVGAVGPFSLFGFQVVLPLAIASANPQPATVSTPFQFQVTVTGGLPPYTISAIGLPAGLSINANGLIFGIPNAKPGPYPITVSIGDTLGLTASSTFNIELSGGALELGGSSVYAPQQAGVAFSQPLTVSGGVPPYTFAVTANPDQSLTISATGILTGTISTAGSQVVAFSVTDLIGKSVTLIVTIPVLPTIATGGIENSASFASGSVAPGEILSIFGTGVGPATPIGATLINNLISTVASGTQVKFGTYSAPILYASATQLNVIVPFEVTPGQNVAITVTSNGETSLPTTVPVAQAIPGIFIIGGSNSPQQAAVLNQNLSVNGPANPAPAGSIIVVYATGGGLLSAALEDGELPDTLIDVADVTLTVGGQPATIDFAGLAPGLAGVLQINAGLPSGLAAGSAVPIVLSIGGASSSLETATIAIQ